MRVFLEQWLHESASRYPNKAALISNGDVVSYQQLEHQVESWSTKIGSLSAGKGQRVAIFLPKQKEAVYGIYGGIKAGQIVVPVNPKLKSAQVKHILEDSEASILITNQNRLSQLTEILDGLPALKHIILIDDAKQPVSCSISVAIHHIEHIEIRPFDAVNRTENDIAALLYTSGSTGKPKGVMLSHRNLVAGAESVSDYLSNSPEDIILALLPLSFDYGLSQVTTALCSGATCILFDYVLPAEVVRVVARYGVTGIAGVPPLWQQLMRLNWPSDVASQLRYFTNSGGAMPAPTLAKLRKTFFNASPYMMYGLTEAFRSTWLPPEMIDKKPDSIGIAIPNAEVLVLRPDGTECDPGETGELVHGGPLVTKGYWRNPEATEARFKQVVHWGQAQGMSDIQVWSGDMVKKDADGFLYFVGRNDDLIKVSGYRISPVEIEEACYLANENVLEAAVLSYQPQGQDTAIGLFVVIKEGVERSAKDILNNCRKLLPNFMHPASVHLCESLPRNFNGKIDRARLKASLEQGLANE